jgi:DNA primase
MSKRIPQEFILQLLERIDIIDVIKARSQITQRGQNHSGRCPFHDEKTPSFSVNQSKQFYYCFGCKAHGNAIGFVMEFDGLEFRDAVEYLANSIGLELPTESQDQHSIDYKPLYAILDQSSQFYQGQLKHSTKAIDYLKSRGTTGLSAKKFALGFAPPGWDTLFKHFSHSAEHNKLLQAGMLNQKETRSYDRFRDRIMYPIRDVRGRTVGFGGRSFNDEPPKYLNSPETAIFHKNNELYGLFEVKQQHKKPPNLIVVEGYMDVIALHQHGFTTAVATLGTAINGLHIKKLLRYSNTIIYCFDADRAGQQAAWKALLASLPQLREGLSFHFLYLPQGDDPDSYLKQHGHERLKKLIDQAPELTKVLFKTLENKHSKDTLASKAALAKEACELFQSMPAGIFKQLLLKKLATELQLNPDELESFASQHNRKDRFSKEKPAIQPSPLDKPTGPLKTLLTILVQQPMLAATFSTELRALTQTQLISAAPEKYSHIIMELAAIPVLLNPEQLHSELKGSINTLTKLAREQQIQALIAQSAQRELQPAEKNTLKELLAQQKDTIS